MKKKRHVDHGRIIEFLFIIFVSFVLFVITNVNVINKIKIQNIQYPIQINKSENKDEDENDTKNKTSSLKKYNVNEREFEKEKDKNKYRLNSKYSNIKRKNRCNNGANIVSICDNTHNIFQYTKRISE